MGQERDIAGFGEDIMGQKWDKNGSFGTWWLVALVMVCLALIGDALIINLIIYALLNVFIQFCIQDDVWAMRCIVKGTSNLALEQGLLYPFNCRPRRSTYRSQ